MSRYCAQNAYIYIHDVSLTIVFCMCHCWSRMHYCRIIRWVSSESGGFMNLCVLVWLCKHARLHTVYGYCICDQVSTHLQLKYTHNTYMCKHVMHFIRTHKSKTHMHFHISSVYIILAVYSRFLPNKMRWNGIAFGFCFSAQLTITPHTSS